MKAWRGESFGILAASANQKALVICNLRWGLRCSFFTHFVRLHKVMRLMLAVLFAVFCFIVVPVRGQPADFVAKINPANVLVDDFQGWGVSLCWWANVV